jgi:hypothetical protein
MAAAFLNVRPPQYKIAAHGNPGGSGIERGYRNDMNKDQINPADWKASIWFEDWLKLAGQQPAAAEGV